MTPINTPISIAVENTQPVSPPIGDGKPKSVQFPDPTAI